MSNSPVVGIIAEYNPFHNGHAYQIAKIHALLPQAKIIAIMSGSFTQRGEPAILDKWQRASLAVRSGIDLVIELPYVSACRSAQQFATGGVRLLAALGCVTHLAFGAETDDLPLLSTIAQAIDTSVVQNTLHKEMRAGDSYAAALANAIAKHHSGSTTMLRQPNNILAIEYLRALFHFAPGIRPILIQRRGTGYHDKSFTSEIASASAIRSALTATLSKEHGIFDWQRLASVMPPSVLQALQTCFPHNYPRQEFLYRALLARLRIMTDAELRTIVGIREGLEHRILRASRIAHSWQNLLADLRTRRYPASNLSRTLLHLLLGFQSEEAACFDRMGPAYLRILAMNPAGASLLHEVKHSATLPILTKITPALNDKERQKSAKDLLPLQRMLRFDLRATELRELALPLPNVSCRDFLISPQVLSGTRSTSGKAENFHCVRHRLDR